MNRQDVTVVMTGATSFVGAAAVRGFLREGVRVIAVVRPGSKKLDKLPINDNILSDRMDVVELDLSGLSRLPEMV